MTKVHWLIVTVIVMALGLASMGYLIRNQTDLTPEPEYKEFVPSDALGPVVRVNKAGKIEIRTATEAEYREAIGNLASTVVQLGTQLDQLKNPVAPKAPAPAAPAPAPVANTPPPAFPVDKQ